MSFAGCVSTVKHYSRGSGLCGLIVAGLAMTAGRAVAQGSLTLPLDARSKGSATAPVTVYEMADFQCPVCRKFFVENFPAIEKEYVATGKVRWVYINYPIPSIHANAMAAAEFAVCSARQGKFWQTHDMLYTMQDQWEKLKNPAPFFQSRIATLGLKAGEMTTCLQTGVGSAIAQDDEAGAKRSGATATPSFYVEGGLMVGLYPLALFRHILDSIYAVKTRK